MLTKYENALISFINDNTLTNPLHTIHHARAQCLSWSGRVDGVKYTILGDDIFSKLFLRYKTRKVRAKDLDLLLSIKP